MTSLNLVCFDNCNLDTTDLHAILQGAADAVQAAGAVTLGGHTVEAPEMKFGLSVTGVIHPNQLIQNSGARKGDQLVLTKRLGTGIITTANKADMASAEAMKQVTLFMKQLNDRTARIMVDHDAHAATDITGFGLLGHAREMARGSKVTLCIHMNRVPVVEEALQLAAIGMIPAGSHANWKHVETTTRITDGLDQDRLMVLADAQTSGGLLIAVSPEKTPGILSALKDEGIEAAHIGEVAEPQDHYLHLIP